MEWPGPEPVLCYASQVVVAELAETQCPPRDWSFQFEFNPGTSLLTLWYLSRLYFLSHKARPTLWLSSNLY